MKLAILCYLPPPVVNNRPFFSDVFLRNLTQNPPETELILYSDHPWPGALSLKASPDALVPHDHNFTLPNGARNTFALNNLVFFAGLKIAKERGLSHILYLESDCRVKGKHWDAKLWNQFFKHPLPAVCGGTPVVYNASNAGPLALARWLDYANRNTRRNFPIKTILPVPPAIYGFRGASERDDTCVFVNGAGGIYDVQWMTTFFPEAVNDPTSVQQVDNTRPNGFWANRLAAPSPPPVVVTAGATHAWDFAIGQEIWKRFKEDSYDLVVNLPAEYSSYGDVITTEQDRLQMLRDGSCVLVHQVKSDATV